MRQILKATALAVAGFIAATSVQAASFFYELSDHPLGGASSTHDYGLRLDRQNPAQFFSFGNGAEAFLFYDADAGTATMYGTVVESTGLDGAGNKTTGGTFGFEYFMTGVTDLQDSNGDSTGLFLVQNGLSFGTVFGAARDGSDIDLGTKSRGQDEYINFTDKAFRGAAAGTYITGEGWVGGGSGANDFLFTATLVDDTPPPNNPPPPNPVPLPAAGWMLLMGLGGMGVMRRRKKSS